MPQQTYEVTAPNGRTLEITGDRMPRGISLPSNAPAAAKGAAAANLFRAAHSAGVVLALPTAADEQAPSRPVTPPAR
jgi:hypothetical protein